ncbi:MAG TPA: 1,6-anhydro-N-acetylmuramyl-L-alanine amidase AmpD [Burkholderiales bacterium]|nr:1,6-anhydro-N-acetylmuramyl-L-alanine amidase AmpD [Burkholderiales bacterium]
MKRVPEHTCQHVQLDPQSVLSGARYLPSPNCDDRPPGSAVELLVIHNISLPPNEFGGSGVAELFTNRLNPAAHPYYQAIRELKVSTHFFVRRDGEILQFVPCCKRAWHAGISNWRGRTRCNDFSIGIELEGSNLLPFRESQYHALKLLTLEMKRTYPIKDIVGHSAIAPSRKADPGPFFDWDRFLKDVRS